MPRLWKTWVWFPCQPTNWALKCTKNKQYSLLIQLGLVAGDLWPRPSCPHSLLPNANTLPFSAANTQVIHNSSQCKCGKIQASRYSDAKSGYSCAPAPVVVMNYVFCLVKHATPGHTDWVSLHCVLVNHNK